MTVPKRMYPTHKLIDANNMILLFDTNNNHNGVKRDNLLDFPVKISQFD